MPVKPLIALTCDLRKGSVTRRTGGVLELNVNFAQAVAVAGGNPIVVTPHTDLEALAPMLDGWLIPGGRDIDAKHFGQENHPRADLQHPLRYATESKLYELADPALPILGICYGCQFLNVRRGGSLIRHMEGHTGGKRQTYEADPDSLLARAAGSAEIGGKSYHHQAIDQVGKGLRVVARHEDGTIEALEEDGPRWLLGVQWHPERSPDDPANANLFRRFVEAASRYRATRRR